MLGFIILAIIVGVIALILWNKSKSKKLFQQIYNHLDNLNRKELKVIIDDLMYALPLLGQDPKERVQPEIREKYGCITRGDASILYDAAVKRSNALLSKERKSAAVKKQKDIEGFTESEKQQLDKLGKLDTILLGFDKARNGDAESMMFIGTVYNLDLKNPKKAFYWMQKADKAGSLQAKYFLGTYYGSGYGVEENKTKGVDLILTAARKGNKDAIDFCIEKLNMSKEEMRSVGISV